MSVAESVDFEVPPFPCLDRLASAVGVGALVVREVVSSNPHSISNGQCVVVSMSC